MADRSYDHASPCSPDLEGKERDRQCDDSQPDSQYDGHPAQDLGDYPVQSHDGYLGGDLGSNPARGYEEYPEQSHEPDDQEEYSSDEDGSEYVEIHLDLLPRNSAIESNVENDWLDSDDDDHTSLSMFHAGYRSYDTAWDQVYEPTRIPMPARKPLPKPTVPSRAPTMLLPKSDQPKDPNLVTWDKDDPANPHDWPAHRRWTSTILIAMFAFIAPMASTMVAPALPTIAAEYKIETKIEEFLVMSIFLLAFAIGPFLWGPLSEVFGRVRVMQGANLIFLIFNTACGFARTKQQMMAFRFLSGIGGSAPQAIGGGILSDCFKAGERGLATAIYSLMPFLSPATAPIMGGYLTQYTTWRWVFWATSLFDVAVQVACVVLLRETHHPTILKKKAQALRKATGNAELHTKWESPDHSMKKILMKALVRPFIMLTTQPALQAMALFRGYQYGLMYLVFATFPMVFEESYGMDVGTASLNYLSLGVGFVVGLQISGLMQDKVYKYCKEHEVDPTSLRNTRQAWRAYRNGVRNADSSNLLPISNGQQHAIARKPLPGRHPSIKSLKRRVTARSMRDPTKGLPEYRLPLVLPFSLLIPIGIFIYGWSAHYKVHWIVPNIGAGILAMGLIVCFNCAQGYVVDTYTTYAASATGAAAFVRTMCGFSFPLFAPAMYDHFGIGWGNSLLGFISLTLGMVAPVLLWRYGTWLRSKCTYCTD